MTQLPFTSSTFLSLVEVLEHYRGAIGEDPGLLDSTDASSDTTQRVKTASERTLALAFLKRADRRTRGNDQYPIALTAAYSLLVNFKPPVRETQARRHIPRNPESSSATADKDGMTFVQAGEIIAGFDDITRDTVLCFLCRNKGHYADKCPNGRHAATSDAVQLLQAGHTTDTHVTDDACPSIELSKFTFTQFAERYNLIPFSTASPPYRCSKTRVSSPTFVAAATS